MSRRNVIIISLVALLLTAFSVALSRRDSRDWRANRSRRLFPFPWQDTSTLTVSKPGGPTLDFFKDGKGEWQIRLPEDLHDSLSNWAVDEFAALATLTWREPLRDARPPQPEQATVITATSGTGQRVEFTLGEVTNNLRAVMVDGDDETLYGVSQDFLQFLDWPVDRFRKYALATAGTGKRPNRIVVSPAGEDTSLRLDIAQRPDGWWLQEPVEWPVDAVRLDLLLRWLERLRGESIEAELSADLEWFGFSDHGAFVEVYYPGPEGDQVRRVEFGGDAGGNRLYARETSRSPIFTVSQGSLAEISLDAAALYPELWKNFYRRRSMNAVGDELPQRIRIDRLLPQPESLIITHHRDRDGIRWQGRLERDGVVREFSIDPPDPDDSQRPLSALLTGLSSLRVQNFLADEPPGPATARWTAFPAWRFTCLSHDGVQERQVTLYAADADGNLPPGQPYGEGKAGPADMVPMPGVPDKAGIAFSFDEIPAVMEIHGELAYLLCRPLYRYQARLLQYSDPVTWCRVEITEGESRTIYTRNPKDINEQWWKGEDRENPLMDDNNLFVTLLLQLSQLRSEGYVADRNEGLEEFGLDRPEITAIVYTSTKEGAPGDEGERLFSLALGGLTSDEGKQRYARLNDAGPVFLVPERLAEALGRNYR